MLRAPATAADVHAALTTLTGAAARTVAALARHVRAVVAPHPARAVPASALADLELPVLEVLAAGLREDGGHGGDGGPGALGVGAALPLSGAGWVVAPGVVPGAERAMAWWLAGAPPRRLHCAPDLAREGRDYLRLPWYAVPAATGGLHVTGPYVDWLCTEGYAMTTTAAVRAPWGFLGVVGVDVEVAAVERALLPLLRDAERPTAVVNAEGRVVVASDCSLSTGALLRSLPVRSWWATAPTAPDPCARLVRLPGLPLGVVTLG